MFSVQQRRTSTPRKFSNAFYGRKVQRFKPESRNDKNNFIEQYTNNIPLSCFRAENFR